MANRLQLKRGVGIPTNIFYEGEPIYDHSGKILFVGDTSGAGSGAGSSIASADSYSAVLEFLGVATSITAGNIKFYEASNNGTNYVQLGASTSLSSNISFVLPTSDGTANQVLASDGNGNLSFIDAVANLTIDDGSTGITTVALLNDTLTIQGTTNEVGVSVTEDTVTIGLPDDVTIGQDLTVTRNLTVSGDLNVVGSAITFQTETIKVEDRLIELGLVNGVTTTSNTTWDTGILFNYTTSATPKKSGIVWLDNEFIAAVGVVTETSGNDLNTPQINITNYAPVVSSGLYISGITSADQLINSSREAVNLIFDGGSY